MRGWGCDVENSAPLTLTASAPSPVLRASCLGFSVRSFKCFLSDSLVLEAAPRGRPWCPRSAPWPRAASHLGQVLASLLVTCTSLNKKAGRDPKWRTLLSSPSVLCCLFDCLFIPSFIARTEYLVIPESLRPGAETKALSGHFEEAACGGSGPGWGSSALGCRRCVALASERAGRTRSGNTWLGRGACPPCWGRSPRGQRPPDEQCTPGSAASQPGCLPHPVCSVWAFILGGKDGFF